jgi:hypothetical protein
MQKFVLEKSKFFPMIAWGTIVCFSVFVFGLVVNLRMVAADLRESTENIETFVDQAATAKAIEVPPGE